MLGRIPWETAWEGKETEKIWPMLKDSLVIAQEQFMPPYR